MRLIIHCWEIKKNKKPQWVSCWKCLQNILPSWKINFLLQISFYSLLVPREPTTVNSYLKGSQLITWRQNDVAWTLKRCQNLKMTLQQRSLNLLNKACYIDQTNLQFLKETQMLFAYQHHLSIFDLECPKAKPQVLQTGKW